MRTRVKLDVCKKFLALLALACLAAAPVSLWAQAPQFKPGFNLFSHDQDIQVGKESMAEVEKQVPLVKDARIESYVSTLGHRLVGFAPGNTDYPWTFKVMNSQDINAFALPGGFIYVNRGVLEAADDEAQVAGVIAHEMGHVVMRHGTHQASQAMLAQMPLAILGGVLGQSGSLTAQLAEVGIGLGVNSLMLKNSRSAESQADQVGTYILYQAGYDPHAMAQFFEIIEKKYPQRTIEFFSDHPNPEYRVAKVDALIPQLGPAKQGRTDSPEFQLAKNETLLSPPGGLITGSQGEWAQAYGASVNKYVPAKKGYGLIDGTEQMVEAMRESNPNLRIVEQKSLRLGGRPALSMNLETDSPLEGKKETDRLVTVRGRDSIIAVMFIAPQAEFESYQPTFEEMLKSLEVR
ncbi:MAG: M48 family metalloprotease [Acidobacteriia bacterium]|nr:M48 family metalloprotease [Terriglobia bacterium]